VSSSAAPTDRPFVRLLRRRRHGAALTFLLRALTFCRQSDGEITTGIRVTLTRRLGNSCAREPASLVMIRLACSTLRAARQGWKSAVAR
jgi:hypothetical protein